MSINFPTDNSTQNIGRTYTAGSVYSGFTTSNYITSFISSYDLISDRQASILTLSNTLLANIDKKQNILVSTCNLVGIGSAITQLDYNNITLNKPDISSFGINYWSLTNTTIFNLNCNLGIGTTDALGYKLNVVGNINANNIYENGSLISSKYLSLSGGTITSNLILNNNLSAVFTEERQYPPKRFTSISGEVPITFLGQSVYTQTITLNTIGITYGSGDYILYSSSVYVGGAGSLYKGYLFNYDFTVTTAEAHWHLEQYSGIGVYLYDKYILICHQEEFVKMHLQ
jgi:hypothetical protein